MKEKVTKNRGWLSAVRRWVDHPWFFRTILGLIVLNAVLVGLETYPPLYESNPQLFHVLDRILLTVFTLEILLRILAAQPFHHFFKEGWNWFDFILVASSYLFVDGQFVIVLRILRVLRVLRAISVLPTLRRLVKALLLTIPALGNILILLGIVFYIFAVIGTILFRDVNAEYFGSLHASLLTLFQVVTLESWASGVMRPVMEEAPWSWVYFVSFILVGTFVVLNLFVGVIVNKVEEANEQEFGKSEPPSSDNNNLQKEITALRHEINELKQMLSSLNPTQDQKERVDGGSR